MSNTTTSFSIPTLHRYSIGFDQIFNELYFNTTRAESAYPPYNIVKLDEMHYAVELAVAGFNADNIGIEFKDGKLIIDGEQSKEDLPILYLHKGISTRTFNRTFTLAANVDVRSATIKDGILVVRLEKLIPDESNSKKINITTLSDTQTSLPK